MNPFKSTEHNFVAQNMVYPGNSFMWPWGEWMVILHCWLAYFTNTKQVKLVDGLFKPSMLFTTDFVSKFSITYWEKSVDVSNYNCEFIYLFLQSSEFLLCKSVSLVTEFINSQGFSVLLINLWSDSLYPC